MLDLYTNIKKYRLEKNMTQEELAKLTGYTDRSSIAKIERGDVDLPQSKIMLFASALNVDAGTLMGNTGLQKQKIMEAGTVLGKAARDPNQIRLLSNYQKLDDDKQGQLLQFSEALTLLP